MIIIYPDDPTTRFLSPIFIGMSERTSADIEQPPLKKSNLEEIFNFFSGSNKLKTILYLGHGASNALFFYNREGMIESDEAEVMFKEKKLILLSCRSSEFLASLNNKFLVGIGFGNILTSKEEIDEDNRNHIKYKQDSYKCIEVFRERLVQSFTNSITEAFALKQTFLQFYNSLKLRINKTICLCSLSKDITEKLVGELMYELKYEMVLMGNPMLYLHSGQ